MTGRFRLVQPQGRDGTAADGLIDTTALGLLDLVSQHHHNPVVVDVEYVWSHHDAIGVALAELAVRFDLDYVNIPCSVYQKHSLVYAVFFWVVRIATLRLPVAPGRALITSTTLAFYACADARFHVVLHACCPPETLLGYGLMVV